MASNTSKARKRKLGMNTAVALDTTMADCIRGALARSGHSYKDVLWVGSLDGMFVMDWSLFDRTVGKQKLGQCQRFAPERVMDEYADGHPYRRTVYPRPFAIANDFVVVGDGWWLMRRPGTLYHWIYCTPPVWNPRGKAFLQIAGKDRTMAELNAPTPAARSKAIDARLDREDDRNAHARKILNG
jgi:hypothetical protein